MIEKILFEAFKKRTYKHREEECVSIRVDEKQTVKGNGIERWEKRKAVFSERERKEKKKKKKNSR